MFSPFLNSVYSFLLIPLSEEIGKSAYNSMIGLADRERVDEELYDDFETAKAREVCTSSLRVPNLFSSVGICLQGENNSD